MKQGLSFGIIISLFIVGLTFMDDVSMYVTKTIYSRQITEVSPNEYQKENEILFLKETADFEADSNQELKNILYTFFNHGYDAMTFYCNIKTYDTCVKDVLEIANDSIFITDISNFVHPFNSHSKITVITNVYGKVELSIEKNYSKDDIDKISSEIIKVINKNITPSMTVREKIKVLHDYIIENTDYDQEFLSNESIYNSGVAIGPLFEGKAICSGYTDLMAIFLDELGIANYKVSSIDHVWNLVKVDGEWLHLDLTWDDPIINNGSESVVLDDYFLITTSQLEKNDISEHLFNKNIYIEGN